MLARRIEGMGGPLGRMPREREPELLLEMEAVEAREGVRLGWRRVVVVGVLVRVLAAAATAAKPDGVIVRSLVLLCMLGAEGLLRGCSCNDSGNSSIGAGRGPGNVLCGRLAVPCSLPGQGVCFGELVLSCGDNGVEVSG